MKITQARLRQLIREAIKKEPLFDPIAPGEIEAAFTNRYHQQMKDAGLDDEDIEKIERLRLSDDPDFVNQAYELLDLYGLEPPDEAGQEQEKEELLKGQERHASMVAIDQFYANLMDPNFGNPMSAMGVLETKESKAWKEILNRMDIKEDLEVIPDFRENREKRKGRANHGDPSDYLYIYASDPNVLEAVKNNIKIHQRTGTSATKTEPSRMGGPTRSSTDYSVYDPMQEYTEMGGPFPSDTSHYNPKHIPGKHWLRIKLGSDWVYSRNNPPVAYRQDADSLRRSQPAYPNYPGGYGLSTQHTRKK